MKAREAAQLAAKHVVEAERAFLAWETANARVDAFETEAVARHGSKHQALQALSKDGTEEYYRYKVLTGPRDWQERVNRVHVEMAVMYATYARMGR